MVALNEPIHMTRNVVTIQSNAIIFHSYDNNCKMVGKKIKSIHYFKTVIRVQRCQAPQLLCYRVINHLQTGAYVLSFLQEKIQDAENQEKTPLRFFLKQRFMNNQSAA